MQKIFLFHIFHPFKDTRPKGRFTFCPSISFTVPLTNLFIHNCFLPIFQVNINIEKNFNEKYFQEFIM